VKIVEFIGERRMMALRFRGRRWRDDLHSAAEISDGAKHWICFRTLLELQRDGWEVSEDSEMALSLSDRGGRN